MTIPFAYQNWSYLAEKEKYMEHLQNVEDNLTPLVPDGTVTYTEFVQTDEIVGQEEEELPL